MVSLVKISINKLLIWILLNVIKINLYVDLDRMSHKYCICVPYKNETMMIGCDSCEEWYHPTCIISKRSELMIIKKAINKNQSEKIVFQCCNIKCKSTKPILMVNNIILHFKKLSSTNTEMIESPAQMVEADLYIKG